ncbi:allosteric NADP-dependent malic enzyme [Litorimonas taeanensis]|uniref:Allosteric NADP-dependent malic enzyme n=1 Tax=Litorimonas taeanensis TaxID=568099 RepID=A0A420WIF1_9PROT|nr:NADP-dependent malic enzyme [Litorimonas taeanensis]RKQ70757.1 allosteric NADP-dependent malic enzyme [Litorimonas taeanensis]
MKKLTPRPPKKPFITDQQALDFHSKPTPGKLALQPTKPMATQRDLSLAYSPGVAVPVEAIAANPDTVYDYTSKGNMVAVISNGTAILGLGNLGAMASKPVMEGKSVLFKRFADIDSFDIEVEEEDATKFIECVQRFGNTFGGINLEDIGSPECFIIEQELRDKLDIPVFHDDQHGTAIIATAGLINACHLTGRKFEDLKLVLSGAGAAGLSVLNLVKRLGVKDENAIVVDSRGVIYQGRTEYMDQWKAPHAVKTDKRTLAEAIEGADVFFGLSVAGIVSKEMVASMAPNPIIFAMANPDPEILPELIKEVRDDAIIATGRSDYPNQVNNVLGFPYIFRGALDVRARNVNEEMKLACAQALADLARQDVPEEVAAAYHGARPSYGPDYIIPAPFDPRLISEIPPYVAQAAMDTGVARKPIEDMDAYRKSLARRQDPTAAILQGITASVQSEPKTIVFAEGEEPAVIRAAQAFQQRGLGKAILIGREKPIYDNMKLLGIEKPESLTVLNARLFDRNAEFTEHLYSKLQRKGFLRRDAQRLVNNDRNVFSALLLHHGLGDGMVTGVTRSYDIALNDVKMVLGHVGHERTMGVSVVVNKSRTLFISDTNVTELPTAEDLADIAESTAHFARQFGFDPRVAFLSYSTFGNPVGERMQKVREAVRILDGRDVNFEYEGDIAADVALDPMHVLTYPFSRLTSAANVLVMPAIHSASISTKLLDSVGGATVLGPFLTGLEKPVQICSLGATASEIAQMATLAAYAPSHREEI